MDTFSETGNHVFDEWRKNADDRVFYPLHMYSIDALRTAKLERSQNELLQEAALGLPGEVGELADHVKKVLFHGHEFDPDVIADEAGDVLWYLALLAHALGVPLEQIALRNIAKLRERYPDGFDSERSRERYENECRFPR